MVYLYPYRYIGELGVTNGIPIPPRVYKGTYVRKSRAEHMFWFRREVDIIV